VRETLARQWGTEIRVVRNPLLDVLRDAERDVLAVSKVCHDMGVAEALVEAVRVDADRYVAVMAGVAARLGWVFDEAVIDALAVTVAELGTGGAP